MWRRTAARASSISPRSGLSSTYFVSLLLSDASGNTVSRNFYWLSTTPETLDWEKSTWYVTPTKTFADYTALNRLPVVNLEVTARAESPEIATVTVTNPISRWPSLCT